MQQSTRSFQCFKWNIRGSDNHLVLSGSSGGSGDTTSDGRGGGYYSMDTRRLNIQK